MAQYHSYHTGQQIDQATDLALNPDATPTDGSSNLITSDAVYDVQANLASIHATGATNTTGAAIASGTYFYLNGVLVHATANIANGATFTSGTNYTTVTAGGLNDLKSAFEWKTGNSTTDKTVSVQIPNSANEIIADFQYRTDIHFTFHFCKAQFSTTTTQYYDAGLNFGTSGAGLRIKVGNYYVGCDVLYINGGTENYKLQVYYR